MVIRFQVLIASFRFLGDGQIYGYPVGIIIAFIITLAIMNITIQHKIWKQYLFCRRQWAGCKVFRNKYPRRCHFKTYLTSSLLAGFAGVLLISKVNSANPIAGSGYEFDAIAAQHFIDGTPFDGGKGGVFGTLIGACIIATLRNGLNMLGFTPPIQFTLIGFIIVLIIIFDVLNEKYKQRREGVRKYNTVYFFTKICTFYDTDYVLLLILTLSFKSGISNF